MHPYIGWDSEFNDYALSPCGRYLATGRHGYDDGPLQIWEMATGRAVNKLGIGEDGVGWSDHRDTIQWSTDGTRLAPAFNTNMVGLWDPFGRPDPSGDADPFGDADVTNGLDCPRDFALSPDGRRSYISMRSSHQVMGCIAALDQGQVFYNDSRKDGIGPKPEMLPEPLPEEFRRRLNDDEWFFRRVRWSRDGRRLLGFNGEWACAVDVPGGRMRWLAHTKGFVEWSPDDRRFASLAVASYDDQTGRLTVFESETGSAVGAPVEQLRGTLHWGMRGETARLAVVAQHGGGVDVYEEDGGHKYHLDIHTTERIGGSYWDGPKRPWAWSPAGEHGACLTSDDRIEVWSLGDIGGYTLRFVRPLTGDVLGDFVSGREDEEGLGPVGEDDELHGDYTADTFPRRHNLVCPGEPA